MVMYLSWPENKNLLPEAPQNTAMSSPRSEVRKTSGEYLAVRSFMNFSGQPLFAAPTKSRDSPMMGHPFLPGGRLGEEDFFRKTRNRR